MTTADNSPSLPMARVIPLSELPGRLSKRFTVPPGRLGITIDAQGRARTFPPGTHRLLTFFERLGGRSVGLKVGYIPAGAFAAQLNATYLLSGDGILLDAGVSLAVTVSDPESYFNEQVLPRGEIRQAVIDLSEEVFRVALGDLVRRYTAADLIHGLPTNQLAGELRLRLEAVLSNQGLQVSALHFISFWRSEERAEVAEKVQALEERLRGVEVERQMAEIDTQAQLDGFVQQMAPELSGHAGLRPVGEAAAQAESPSPRRKLGEIFSAWLPSHPKQEKAEKKHPRLQAALGDKPAEKKIKRPPRSWWLPGVLFMLALLILGCALSWVLFPLLKNISLELTWGVITGVWLMVLPLFLETLRRLIQRREEISQQAWIFSGITHLDELVKRDRKRADGLVRQQCRSELIRVAEIFDGLQSSIYKAGNTALALRLRDSKRKAEAGAEQVMQPEIGVPPYMNDLNITDLAWDKMLDYDEDLLLFASALADTAHQFQQSAPQGVDEAGLEELDRQVDVLLHRFNNRSRVLRAG